MTKKSNDKASAEDKTVKANELVGYVKSLIAKGNVRRLIIKKPSGKKVLEIPLTAGVGIGGALIFMAPILAAVAAVAALLAEFKVEVIRTDEADDTSE